MRKLIILLTIISFQLTLTAQDRTHIPYSVYGLGEIFPKGFARNFAMGRTGIALTSTRYLNSVNPASYHSIDSVSFFFDFGLAGEMVKYRTSSEGTQRGNDFNIRNLAMGFRIARNWTSSIGIAPYSSVGYKIQTTKSIIGTPDETFDAEITGSGGLNQFYWGNSYLLFDRLSLGVNFTYLFGDIESSETVRAAHMNDEFIIKQSSYLNKLYADFGIQYLMPEMKDFQLTLGGVFGNTHQLNFKNVTTITESSSSIPEEEITGRGTFEFPMYAGAGFGLVYKNALTVTADYLYHDWSNTSSDNINFDYKSTNTFRLGLELIPGRYSQLGYFGGIAYRAGFYYEQSYLELKNQSISDKGVSFGLGFPFLQNRTSINLSYNYGINGTLEKNLIKENYHSFMFSFTLHDWWFIQRKID